MQSTIVLGIVMVKQRPYLREQGIYVGKVPAEGILSKEADFNKPGLRVEHLPPLSYLLFINLVHLFFLPLFLVGTPNDSATTIVEDDLCPIRTVVIIIPICYPHALRVEANIEIGLQGLIP